MHNRLRITVVKLHSITSQLIQSRRGKELTAITSIIIGMRIIGHNQNDIKPILGLDTKSEKTKQEK